MDKPTPGAMIPFAHAVNFRELGGYPATDGRHVRYGQFYRGGCLDELDTAADRTLLDSFHLKTVLDLRSAGETAARPDPVLPGVEQVRISGMQLGGGEVDYSPAAMQTTTALTADMLERAVDMAAAGQNPLAEAYRNILLDNAAYRFLVRCMVEKRTPILFHCAAGKDRTGMAAVLILLLLGVDRKTAVADYALTNIYRKAEIDAFVACFSDLTARRPEFAAILANIEGVNPAMAEQAIDAVLEKYGGLESYFTAEYGLDKAAVDALRDRYLE